jgi:hypothetical protein
VRHLRMVVACLIASLAVGAIGAGSALAKDPYTANTWGQYKGCPYELYGQPEPNDITDCFAGITAGGSKGGYFEYGHVQVKLNKSIYLQGGFSGAGSEIKVFPAAHGRETLEAPPLKVTRGLALFTKAIQKETEWPAALVQSFNEAKKNKENVVNAQIELAGTELFTVIGSLDTENILFEEGDAFKLPLKVKVTSPWLEKLGSGVCEIGSDEHPIHINLTSQGAGRSGELFFNEAFTNIWLRENKLVDFGWHIEEASAPTGCGGEYEQYIDAALGKVLEIGNSGRTGIVVLQGSVHDAAASAVLSEGFASGELP